MKRDIITIDEQLCDGCGNCIPGCPEGALQLIDGKARLVSDLFCDGLGACIGSCPQGAIVIESREAEPYDEHRVMTERIIPQGEATIIAHLKHLLDHGADTYYQQAVSSLRESYPGAGKLIEAVEAPQKQEESGCAGGCPGSLSKIFGEKPVLATQQSSALTHWPIQMHLLNPASPQFRGKDFLFAADCTAFSLGAFHSTLLAGKALGIGCPKLDAGTDIYRDKLIKLIDHSGIHTLTVAIMEVPCCGSLLKIALDAVSRAQRRVPVKLIQISVEGDILKEEWVA